MKNNLKILTSVATILSLTPITFTYAMESENIDIQEIQEEINFSLDYELNNFAKENDLSISFEGATVEIDEQALENYSSKVEIEKEIEQHLNEFKNSLLKLRFLQCTQASGNRLVKRNCAS